jgi:hypothetical protein
MVVTIVLDSGLGADTGPNFNLTANVGTVTPSSATKAELIAGKQVTVSDTATQITVTSIGTCTNSVNLTITGQTTTTTTATPAQFSLGYSSLNFSTSCVNYGSSPITLYAITGATLIVGTVLYSNQSITSIAPNGWYSNGVNWWRIGEGGGTITSTGSCSTTTTSTSTTTAGPTTTTSTSTSTSTTTTAPTTTASPASFVLGYSAIDGPSACYKFTDPIPNTSTYYSDPGATLGNGIYLNTNSNLTILAPSGYYSNGTNYWYIPSTCFEYNVTNSSGTDVNIQFKNCDDEVLYVTVLAGTTENICAKDIYNDAGCTVTLVGIGICSATTNGILQDQTPCPQTTTTTSTTSTTSTSTSTTTSTSTSTTTLPPTTSTTTSTSTSSTTTSSTTTAAPTTTSTSSTTTTTLAPGESTSTTSTSTTTEPPTTTTTTTAVFFGTIGWDTVLVSEACSLVNSMSVTGNDTNFCNSTSFTSTAGFGMGTANYYLSDGVNYIQCSHTTGTNLFTRISAGCTACPGATSTTTTTTTSAPTTTTTTTAPTTVDIFIQNVGSLDIPIGGMTINGIAVTWVGYGPDFYLNAGDNGSFTSTQIGTYDVVISYGSHTPGQRITFIDSDGTPTCQTLNGSGGTFTITNATITAGTTIGVEALDGICP